MRPPASKTLRAGLAAYAVLILAIAVLPGGTFGGTPPDKLLHAAAYGAFTLLALAARFPGRGGTAGSMAVAVGHGAAIEALQAMLSWRTAEWGDLAADAVGSVLGAGLWWLVRRCVEREDAR